MLPDMGTSTSIDSHYVENLPNSSRGTDSLISGHLAFIMIVAWGYLVEAIVLEAFALSVMVLSGLQTYRVFFCTKRSGRNLNLTKGNSTESKERKSSSTDSSVEDDSKIGSEWIAPVDHDKIGNLQKFFPPVSLCSGVIGALWCLDRRCVFGIWSPRSSTLISFVMHWPNWACAFYWSTEVMKVASEVAGLKVYCFRDTFAYLNVHLGFLFFNIISSIITLALLTRMDRRWILSVHLVNSEVMLLLIAVMAVICLTYILRVYYGVKHSLSRSMKEKHLEVQSRMKRVLGFVIVLGVLLGLLMFSYSKDPSRTWISMFPMDPSVYELDLPGAFSVSAAYCISCILLLYIGWIPFNPSRNEQKEGSGNTESRRRTTLTPSFKKDTDPQNVIQIENFPHHPEIRNA